MSTILNTNGTSVSIPELHKEADGKFYVFTADWNEKITHALRDGATGVLRRAGIAKEKIISMSVPGAVELVNAAATVFHSWDKVEAIIVIGCVIRGDTPHFDYVCKIVSEGVRHLNTNGKTPVVFGVLTVDNEQQALDRAGGILGNKGEEAAVAAIEMANLHAILDDRDSISF